MFHWLVVERGWSSVGAQEFPFGQRILSEQTLSTFLYEKNVVLIAGPIENQLITATNA
jgi:hypothetical protein